MILLELEIEVVIPVEEAAAQRVAEEVSVEWDENEVQKRRPEHE